MKMFIVGLLFTVFMSCSKEEAKPEVAVAEEVPIEALLNKAHPEGAYGVAITAEQSMDINTLLDTPEQHTEKAFFVDGNITEVCPMKGCWIDIADADGETIRVKVTDGEIVFPLSAKGQQVRVQGKLEKLEMNEEQHRQWKAHLAEEKGETFDPQSVSGPLTTWRIRGEGAVIGG